MRTGSSGDRFVGQLLSGKIQGQTRTLEGIGERGSEYRRIENSSDDDHDDDVGLVP